MASRFPIPSSQQMRLEDDSTLQRESPNQAGPTRSNGYTPDPPAQKVSGSIDKHDDRPLQRRRFVFTDPVAFRYLESDPATVVLERRVRLKGYEIYLVEQWACSRVHPTFIITTYTGDQNHSVLVGILGVPADEESWSPGLRVYFKAISQFHARPKETPLGMLMVTNLSSFPSALTVIPVPDGDVRRHREDFIVNEDLKRLGCSGRSGLNLATPAGATQAKFHQLYKTSNRIPFYGAVIELVKLCQVALLIFGKLEQEYADGLLCDVTEKAINDWWIEIGSEYYNIEPSDGILGPTTVAALLGMLMGARNRLHCYGAPVAKDVFDISSLKRGIEYFQKSQKLPRTRRLDRQTLTHLHRVTAKAAAGEGWAVPKAVKSTVAELSGKGGDMVMGMVGGARDKAGIGDIETLDIDRFVSLIHGERSKWLWQGKARRSGTGETFGKSLPEMGNMVFSKDDQGGYVWSNKRSDPAPVDDDTDGRKRDSGSSVYSSRPPGSVISMVDSPVAEKDQHLRKTVFKSVTGKMSDARSGFGRIKGAVGFRGHISRHSKDDSIEIDSAGGYFSPSSSTLEPGSALSSTPGAGLTKSHTWKNKPEEYQDGYRKLQDPGLVTRSISRGRESESPPNSTKSTLPHVTESVPSDAAAKDSDAEAKWLAQVKEIRRDLVANDLSVAESVYGDVDLEGPLLEAERDPQNASALLYRRHSISEASPPHKKGYNEARWPRHMSFSYAEEAVLSWRDIGVISDESEDTDAWVVLQKQRCMTEGFKQLYDRISILQNHIGAWVERQVDKVEDLDNQANRDRDDFQTLYYQLSEAYQSVKQNSRDILTGERSKLMEAIKDIEVLKAKLEYEINALISKVEDVEDEVNQFEIQVHEVETRAVELGQQLKSESWLHWAVRSLTGLGTAPHRF